MEFELLSRSLLSAATEPTHFLINGDNNRVVEGWWNGHSRNSEVNMVICHIHLLIKEYRNQHSLHTTYIQSKFNPIDSPSRGIYPSTAFLLPPISLPSGLEQFLIDSQEPLSPIEQIFLHKGHYPTAVAKFINTINEWDQVCQKFHFNIINEPLPHFRDGIKWEQIWTLTAIWSLNHGSNKKIHHGSCQTSSLPTWTHPSTLTSLATLLGKRPSSTMVPIHDSLMSNSHLTYQMKNSIEFSPLSIILGLLALGKHMAPVWQCRDL